MCVCVRERELTNDWRSALLGWPSGASLMLRGRSLSQQAKYSAPRGSTKPCARSMWWAMGLTILDRRLNAKSSYYIPCVCMHAYGLLLLPLKKVLLLLYVIFYAHWRVSPVNYSELNRHIRYIYTYDSQYELHLFLRHKTTTH